MWLVHEGIFLLNLQDVTDLALKLLDICLLLLAFNLELLVLSLHLLVLLLNLKQIVRALLKVDLELVLTHVGILKGLSQFLDLTFLVLAYLHELFKLENYTAKLLILHSDALDFLQILFIFGCYISEFLLKGFFFLNILLPLLVNLFVHSGVLSQRFLQVGVNLFLVLHKGIVLDS
jgi:hypothetical protein